MLDEHEKILRDWDWKKAQGDLKLISQVLNIEVEPIEEPCQKLVESGLLHFQPNRSIQPLAQHLSSLLARIPPPEGNPPQVYSRSMLVPAQFLLGPVLVDLNPSQRSLNLLLDCLHLQASVPLHNSLLKLISEFSRVYHARLMINKLCASESATNKLTEWHQATSSKNTYNCFDDERDRCEEAFKLFELELSRGGTN